MLLEQHRRTHRRRVCALSKEPTSREFVTDARPGTRSSTPGPTTSGDLGRVCHWNPATGELIPHIGQQIPAGKQVGQGAVRRDRVLHPGNTHPDRLAHAQIGAGVGRKPGTADRLSAAVGAAGELASQIEQVARLPLEGILDRWWSGRRPRRSLPAEWRCSRLAERRARHPATGCRPRPGYRSYRRS